MIDDTDRAILALLQEDARLSHGEIGERVGLTASSVYERVRKLRERGVIQRTVAVVDPAAVGKPITAFVRLTLAAPPGEDYAACKRSLVAACQAEPDIQECHMVAGEDCYVLKVRVGHPGDLEGLLDRLRGQATVASSISNIVLSTVKETTVVTAAG